MPLSTETRLGPYEILAPLGVGGMGEVYRDTKLGREVAIKVLPAGLARDPDRLERFEREARLLAVLNHPNIAAIYGLEQSDRVPFLVLELVPGPTLAELAAGPLFSFDISARQARQLTFSMDDKFTASWSPDGRWLVYSSNASGYVQLWRMPATGGEAQRLTEGSDRIRHMFYSSDGRWLYFQPNHLNILNIYRMPAAGGPAQQVTRFPESCLFLEEPTISPDNRYLVYCRGNGGSSFWLLKIGTASSGSD